MTTTFPGRLTDLLGIGDPFGRMTITAESIELTGALGVRYAFTKDDLDEIVYQRMFLPWMWVLAFVGRDGKDSPAYFSPLGVFAQLPSPGKRDPISVLRANGWPVRIDRRSFWTLRRHRRPVRSFFPPKRRSTGGG